MATTAPSAQPVLDLIDREFTRFDVPGLAVAMVHGGRVEACEAVGVLDLTSGTPVTTGTRFPLASDTKAVVAATFAQLAADGRVDLDAPLRELIPWLRTSRADTTAGLSLRDLLSQRSGLPRHDLATHGAALTLEQVTRRLEHLPLTAAVRSRWQYTNLGYCLVGYALEHICGRPWHEVVQTALLEPLQMTDTRPALAGDETARPYRRFGDAWRQLSPPPDRFAHPGGGLTTTAHDLTRWLLARLGHAPGALGPAALDLLHAPAIPGGLPALYDDEWIQVGYGLGCQIDIYRGHRLVRHGGNLAGYETNVCLFPDDDLGVAVLTNAHYCGIRDAIPLILADQLLGLPARPWGQTFQTYMTELSEARRKTVPSPAKTSRRVEIADHVGGYRHHGYGELRIAADGKRLRLQLNELDTQLELRSQAGGAWDLFVWDYDLAFPVEFERDASSRVVAVNVLFEPELEPIRFVRADT